MNGAARAGVAGGCCPLIVVAHVDDDGLGFGIGIRERAPATTIVYLTDGAPRDPAYWTTPWPTRAAYAAQRRAEAGQAARRLGVAPDALHFLDAVDMEAYRELPRLDRALRALVSRNAYDAIWSPAYDGGHPDHDAAAFLAARAARHVGVRHYEFALYRHAGKRPVAFRFATGPAGSVRHLDDEELAFKRELLAVYTSQLPIVRTLDLRCERYRPAPAHAFGRRPVPGPTLYEAWGWPMTAEILSEAFTALESA